MDPLKVAKIVRKLLFCEYPFRWQPRVELESVPDDMIRRLEGQLEEKIFDEDFQFERVMLYVGLAYEYAIENRFIEALNNLEMGDYLTEELRKKSSESHHMARALQHIIMSSKVYMLLWKEDLRTALTIVNDIPEINNMKKEDQAAVYGLHALFLSEYGINGTKLALKYSSRAIETDPDESLWYFLKGKLVSRIRRAEQPFDVPEREEIELLEAAVKQRSNPAYIVFTAQTYRETASRIFSILKRKECLSPERRMFINKLNEKAVELYKKSIELKPDCAHMLFRCAKGFLLLPRPYRDEKKAKEYLEKGLEKAPESGYGNHAMAQFFDRIEKDPQKAMKYLRICEKKEIFGAAMDLIRLEFRNGVIDIVQRLTDLLLIYQEKPRTCQIYSQLVSYHLFVPNDLRKACEYANEVIRLNVNSVDLLQHRPITVMHFNPINLYDVLVDEIKIRIQDSNCEDRPFFDEFLKTLVWEGISVSQADPQYLKKEILNNETRPRKLNPQGNKSTSGRFNNKTTFNGIRYNRYPSRTTSRHQTDVDQKMSKIFEKCREDFENNRNMVYAISSGKSRQSLLQELEVPRSKEAAESRDCHPREMIKNDPTGFQEKGTRGIVKDQHCHVSGTTKPDRNVFKEKGTSGVVKDQPQERDGKDSEDSDDYDDETFRMEIYKKTKEKLSKLNSNTSKPNEIAASMQEMKIRDDSSKKHRDSTKSSDDQTHSYASDEKEPAEPNNSKRIESHSRSHEKHNSGYSLRREERLRKLENNNDDFERRSNYLAQSRSNKYQESKLNPPENEKRSSNSDNDKFEYSSRRHTNRLHDHEERKSKYSMRPSREVEDDRDVFERTSSFSKSRSPDYKQPQQRNFQKSSSSNSDDSDNSSRQYKNYINDLNERHSSRMKISCKYEKNDDEFERKSNYSGRNSPSRFSGRDNSKRRCKPECERFTRHQNDDESRGYSQRRSDREKEQISYLKGRANRNSK